MQFLYPTSRLFPFDESCEQIVRALQARNWKVPGLIVEFVNYGSGAQKLRYVRLIKSEQPAIESGQHDIVIEFGRPQAILPGRHWNDVAAVQAVQLTKRKLHVYPDESGPTYDVYVGANWEHDRATWWSSPNARLNGKPRVCVKYSGKGLRAATLTWGQDAREYGPEGEEPRAFDTATVMEEFRVYLRDVVLLAIEGHPAIAMVEEGPVELPIPMPDGARAFFTYGTPRDERRIAIGKKDLSALELHDHYGLNHGNWRLAPMYIKHGPDLPEIAYDGFLWCGTTPTVPGEPWRQLADVLIKVTPKDARGIYVADHAAYEKVWTNLWEKTADAHKSFTTEEVNMAIRARACTVVSILDYKDDYEAPVYLINRELDFDEVEVIGKRP